MSDTEILIWHMATCLDCEPPLPMPFCDRYKRDSWASEHSETGHRVLLHRQEQRR